MRRLPRTCILLVILLGLAAASAQGNADVRWRALYQGRLADQDVTLDLALGEGGFAFGRLTRSGSAEVLDGVGSHDDSEGSVRLEFRPAVRQATSVALDYAFLDPSQPGGAPVVAVLSGVRSLDWADDGATLAAALQYGAAPPLEGKLTRTAQYAFGSLAEGRIDLSYGYPRFLDGGRLNALLEEGATARLAEWALEGRGLVDAAEGLGWGWAHAESTDLVGSAAGYLSLITSYYYYTGGAHPNSHSDSLLVRSGPDGLERVALEELFAPGTAWRPEVTAWVLADLAEQGAASVLSGEVGEGMDLDLSTFTLSPAGLAFHFAPYAVGPYVQGAFTVVLEYASLAHLAAPGGALEAFAARYGAR